VDDPYREIYKIACEIFDKKFTYRNASTFYQKFNNIYGPKDLNN